MFDLTGRKALVTGAPATSAKKLAAAGTPRRSLRLPAIVGKHAPRVEKRWPPTLGDRVKIFPANLSDRDEVKALGERQKKANSKASTSSSTMPASPRTACSSACRMPTGMRFSKSI